MRTAAPLCACLLATLATATAMADRAAVVFATRGDERLTALDAATLEPIWNHSLGLGAHELVISPDGSRIAGSAYGGPGQHHNPADNRVVVFEVARPEAYRVFDLGEHMRPNDMAFMPDGRQLLVTSEAKSALLRLDTETGEIVESIRLDYKGGHMLAADTANHRVYVSHVLDGVVSVVDLELDAVIGEVRAESGAEGIAVTPDGSAIWCANNRSGTITVFEGDSLRVLETIECGGFPFRVRCTPDGAHVVVSLAEEGVLAIYDAESRRLVRKASLDAIGPRPLPTSIAISPDSRTAYAVCNQPPMIVAIEIESGNITARHHPLGTIPDGLAAGMIDG